MREALSFNLFADTVLRMAQTRSARLDRVVIPVERPQASIGATPSVAVASVAAGFDWDSGTLFIYPQQPLTALSPDELEEIRQCRKEGQSWAVYKARERWDTEKDALVAQIHALRAELQSYGVSPEKIDAIAGPAPAIRTRRRITR
ncbi:hypothetical protein D7B12_18070 [Salmonella enterica]|nr:hypothetical protein [Salmonella enterica]